MSSPDRRPIEGPCAWRGEDISGPDDWIRPLSSAALDEIDAALRAVQARGLAWRKITRDDFPLPRFAGELRAVADELERGRGFLRLRGLQIARYDEDEIRQIFWGIGTHLGVARPQDASGEIMGEVCDEARAFGAVRETIEPLPDGARPLTSRARARSNGPLRFHTDRADVIALLCVRRPRAGGLSKIASSVAVHNEILARRPDLLELLYRDYYRSRQGEEAQGASRHYALPVFAVHEGHFTSQYSRTFVEAAQHIPGVPRLTPAQDEALDLLAEVAEELCIAAPFEPGDMQFLNNHVIYHARSAFEDGDDGRNRLLYRLWLSMPDSRPLPPGFEILWGRVEPGALRGGITQHSA
ncbi:MAG: TauD/TfdA family dioxygenase [Alphaproteobacteria bacterium]